MDIYFRIRFSVESFVCLKRYKNPVSDSVCFENNLCRVDLRDISFNIVDHFVYFLYVMQN